LNLLTLAFMVGTGAAVAVCFAARRAEPRRLRMALAIAASWALGIWLHHQVGPPFRKIYPMLDFALALYCCLLIVEEHGPQGLRRCYGWKAIVLCALMTQMGLHVLYPTHLSLSVRYPYLVALNVLYAIILVALAWIGVGYVRNLVGRLLVPGPAARSSGYPQ